MFKCAKLHINILFSILASSFLQKISFRNDVLRYSTMKKALLNLCEALKHERKAHFIPIKTITHHIEMGEICHHIPTVFSTKW